MLALNAATNEERKAHKFTLGSNRVFYIACVVLGLIFYLSCEIAPDSWKTLLTITGIAFGLACIVHLIARFTAFATREKITKWLTWIYFCGPAALLLGLAVLAFAFNPTWSSFHSSLDLVLLIAIPYVLFAGTTTLVTVGLANRIFRIPALNH